ncbi:MAG: hypothetical protein Q7U47_01905 [Paludibacter sp.]|nr:hypothetical protein [Paludibacter sp.]
MKTTQFMFIAFVLILSFISCKKDDNEIKDPTSNILNGKVSKVLPLNAAMAAAWYVIRPEDIDALEKIGFNLFFLNRSDYETMTTTYRNQFIQNNINALNQNSKIVLPIDNFLNINWFGSGGMEEFMNTWGGNPKIYGFLLKDDVATTPFYFSGTTNLNPDALWIYRWYYKMIRNTAEDQRNSYNKDLALGKKIIVTLPFENGAQNSNNVHKFYINTAYNVPTNFFTPGDSWDFVMPYWYPHKTQISIPNEEYIMDVLYGDMHLMFANYLSSVIPIIQTAAEDNIGDFLLEHDDNHGYDLSIQYNKFITNSLVTSKIIAYYSANGHSGVYDNLLHKNYVWDTTQTNNIYYREAKNLNIYHFSLFP